MKNLLIILTSAVVAGTAGADVTVFDTFGPGDTYNPMLGFQIGGGANNEEIAAQFTAGASGNLANVALGLTYRLDTDPAFRAVNVFLYGDASGSPDNANQTLLGSSTPIALFDGVTNNSVVSFSVAGTVPVTMGSLYYLVLKPTSRYDRRLDAFCSDRDWCGFRFIQRLDMGRGQLAHLASLPSYSRFGGS